MFYYDVNVTWKPIGAYPFKLTAPYAVTIDPNIKMIAQSVS